MTRLSLKDSRPDTTRPCPNAKDGCPNRAPMDRSACDDCRRGKPIPPRAGIEAILADARAARANRGATPPARDQALAKLKRLVGPSALDNQHELTLDRIPAYQDEQFRRVVREFCDAAGTTLSKICREAVVPFGSVWSAFKNETEISVANMNRMADAMKAMAGCD